MQKSQALRKIAEVTLERIKDTDIDKYPSNILVDYYETIHKLLEAITSIEGTKIKGEGAHQELIDYVTKNYSLDEQTRQLLQQMRDYRNRISYEGLMINKNYILLNEKKLKEIIELLLDKLSKLGEGKGKA
ncbi:hypothetical protein HYU16_04520 [Candidatus Woesearchaeota archaeon]|nr:hypothetical protein [Candidatus Woesearchaeota archaeon]